ncbi:MAG: hypothetical protein CMD38_04260 [Flavobacteriales bacterium]|nr:hypothetical protein [Flavobacteriales bacterium]|tara:strand:+ start:5095 stop:5859 length:765 start_codon:yes stop_codon:yes gene_type:complete
MQSAKEYLIQEGLNKYIKIDVNADFKEGVFDAVSGKLNIPFPPVAEDLARLHRLMRKRKAFTVLEFGSGLSTIVMADALSKNKADFLALEEKPELRNRFMFQIFSVESDKQWIEHSQSKIPKHLLEHVNFHYSEIKIDTFNGRICHFYDNLPDIVPDFIYLDGPNPKDVKGNVNGMTFQCDERTVMAADLLLMESILLPGTFILVDGRTNNARFLKKNFQRNFEMSWDKDGDVTSFELQEERLGKYNILGSDFY